MATYDDAVSREAAWFNAANVPGLPNLLTSQSPSGKWDRIEGYPRKITPSGREIFLWRDHVHEDRTSMGGRKDWTHRIVATCTWSITKASGNVQDDQAAFDAALADAVARVRGVLLDKTHGGRFLEVGEGVGDEGRIHVDYVDPWKTIEVGLPFQAHVHYFAADSFVA